MPKQKATLLPATKELTHQNLSLFEQIRQTDEKGNEFWNARDLSKVLEYSEYRHFLPVIERAKEACKNSSQDIKDHFEDFLEMVTIGSGANRTFGLCHFSEPWVYGNGGLDAWAIHKRRLQKEFEALQKEWVAVQNKMKKSD